MKVTRQKHEISLHTRWFSVTIGRVRQKRLELQRDGFWRTKDGTLIHVSQMGSGHLLNTIRFLERKALKEARLRFPDPYLVPPPRGEMAQDLYWRGMDEYDLVAEVGVENVMYHFLKGQPVYELMVKEAWERGLEKAHEERTPRRSWD